MKVLIFDPSMVNDYTEELTKNILKKEISVILYSSIDSADKELLISNIDYHNKFISLKSIRNKTLKKILKLFLYIFIQIYFLKVIKKEKPDIIHLQWSRIPIVDSFFIHLFKKNAPVVLTLHNTTLNHGDYSSLFTKISLIGFKKLLKKVSGIVLLTNYSKETFAKKFPDFLHKVKVIPHGLLNPPTISKNKFNFQRKAKTTLLFFGNIQKYKGLDVLIESLSYLEDKNFNLLIAGRPQIAIDEFKEYSKKLGVDNKITWHPFFIEKEDLPEIFKISDVIILPYRHIDQSGILTTAVNYEKPIIASNIGGFSEIIEDGKHGYLFKNEDAKDLAEKISFFIKNREIINFSQEISLLKNNWKSWSEISTDHIIFYREIIKNNE